MLSYILGIIAIFMLRMRFVHVDDVECRKHHVAYRLFYFAKYRGLSVTLHLPF